MSLLRLPRFHCYEGGSPGGIGGVGTSGPGSAAGIGGGPDPGMGMGMGGMMASNPGGFPDYGGSAIAAAAEVARAQEQAKVQAKALQDFMDSLKGLLPNWAKSLVDIGKASAELGKAYGIDPSQAASAANALARGNDPDAVYRALRNNLGVPEETVPDKSNDPKSDAFWEQFVEEWKTAKDNIKANDQFKKDMLAPAFDTYKNRLSGLSREPGFAPINVKFGDFETSFNTRRSMDNAQNILSGELARTDIMQPKSAEMDYLGQLMGLAKWQQEMKNKTNWTSNQKRPDDQGSWLDVINDTLKVVKTGKDVWDLF